MKIFDTKGRSDRSGSMQLSINAIVILVLAMAVLGLGLGIVKGVRNKSDEFLGFDVDLAEDATSTQRIANLDEELVLKKGKENQLGISFYNAEDGHCESEGAKIALNCEEVDSVEDPFEYIQIATKIKQGESGKLLAKIIPNSDLGFGSYACTFQVYCDEEYDEDKIVEEQPLFVNLEA
ncbi:MAG: hypothetical protein ACOCQQ_02075 [Candidatus Nanoarchaeia archaeon]